MNTIKLALKNRIEMYKIHLRNSIRTFFVAILLFTVASKAVAQQVFPVQVISQLISPTPLQLSALTSGTSPKLLLTLTNRDLQGVTLRVKLKVTITGPTGQIRTSDNAVLTPITLPNGIPTSINSTDLAPYFNTTNLDFLGSMSKAQYTAAGRIPEGSYSFCFEVLEFFSNKLLSSSFCSYAYLSLSDPPLLNAPLQNSTILFQNPINIFFNWTPRQLNNSNLTASGVEYRFILKELLDTLSPLNAAYQTARTLHTISTRSTNLVYGASLPQLIPGKNYAWTVQVVANDPAQQEGLRNNGLSDVFGFKYRKNCNTPENVTAMLIGQGLNVNWLMNPQNKEYKMSYREAGTGLWTDVFISNGPSFSSINPVQSGKTYEIKVGTVCDNINTNFSNAFTVSVPLPPPPPVAKKLAKVFWGYNEMPSYPASNSLIGANAKANEIWAATAAGGAGNVNNKSSNLPLNKATITLLKNGQPSSTEQTDNSGNFSIAIDTGAIIKDKQNKWSLSVEFTNASTLFTVPKVVYDLSAETSGKKILSKISDTTVMIVKSIIINPTILPLARQGIAANAKGASLEVFIPKTEWEKSYKLLLGSTAVATTISNNGIDYIKVADFDDKNTFKNIVCASNYTSLITRVSMPEALRFWYPIPLTLYNNQLKYSAIYSAPVQYDPIVRLFGTVASSTATNARNVNGALVRVASSSADGTALTTIRVEVDRVATGVGRNSYTLNLPGAYALKDLKLGFGVGVGSPFSDIKIKLSDTSTQLKTDYILGNIVPKTVCFGRILNPEGIPISNAKVFDRRYNIRTSQFDASYLFATTDENGYFIGKRDDAGITQITVEADGYNTLDTKFSFVKGYTNEKALINAVSIVSGKQSSDSLFTSSESFSYGQEIKASPKYRNQVIIKPQSKEKNVEDALMYITQPVGDNGNYEILDTILLDKKSGNVFTVSKYPGNKYNFIILPNPEKVTATNPGFLPFAGSFNSTRAPQTIIAQLKAMVVLAGSVKDSASGAIIDSVDITVEGMGEYSGSSNTQGLYTIGLPAKEITLHFARDGYLSMDTTINFTKDTTTLKRSINFLLTKNTEALVVSSLSGYDIELEEQRKGKNDTTFFITGKILLESNNVFTTTTGNDKLSFENIEVTVDADGNAYPVKDEIKFTETILNAKAFDFAPVEITNLKLIPPQSSDADERKFSVGVVTGNVKLKLSNVQAISPQFPFKLPDATLQLPNSDYQFQYIFISPDEAERAAFSEDQSFPIKFGNAEGGSASDTTIKANIFSEFNIQVSKTECSLDGAGINLEGFFKIPTSLLKTERGRSNDDLVDISGTIIGADLKLESIGLDFEDNPLQLKMGKLQTKLTGLEVTGIGTRNPGIGFSGEVWFSKKTTPAKAPKTKVTKKPRKTGRPETGKVKKTKAVKKTNKVTRKTVRKAAKSKTTKTATAKPKKATKKAAAKKATPPASDEENVLVIEKFFIQKAGSTFNASLSLKLPESGINIKNLSFTTNNEDDKIEMAYDGVKKSFSFEVAGTLDWKSSSTARPAGGNSSSSSTARAARPASSGSRTSSAAKPKPPIVSNLFPIEIQTFKFDSEKWSVFFVAKSDLKIDIKVAKIAIQKLVVNVGTDMTVLEMQEYLKSDAKPAEKEEPGAAPDDPVDVESTKTAWGIGIKGGLEFDVKGMEVDAKAQFVFGEFGGEFKFAIDSISLGLKNKAFKFDTKVALKLEGDSIGFNGSGSLTMAMKTFKASFGYYKIRNTSTYMQASISVPLNGVKTGPVSWYSGGGGFIYESIGSRFMVYLKGECGLSPTKPTTGATYLSVDTLGILFEGENCGIKPILRGSARLFLKDSLWGKINATVDFCRNFLEVTVNLEKKNIIKGVDCKVDGVMFGQVKANNEAAFFLSINAQVNLGDIANGNAQIALGINFDKNEANVTQAAKTAFDLILTYARNTNQTSFDGIYLNIQAVIPQTSGSWNRSIGIGIFSAGSVNVNYSYGAEGQIEFYYNYSTNNFNAKLKINANASATAVLSIVGTSPINFGGGAEFALALEGGYNNTDGWNIAGSVAMSMYLQINECACNDYKTSGGFAVKVCIDKSAAFSYKQKGSPKWTFSLN